MLEDDDVERLVGDNADDDVVAELDIDVDKTLDEVALVDVEAGAELDELIILEDVELRTELLIEDEVEDTILRNVSIFEAIQS
jgi:hypothetical protein